MWNCCQFLSMTIPLESILSQQPGLWLRPKDLPIIHQESVDVVFGSRESEAITDLLLAWTAGGYCYELDPKGIQ